MRLRTGVVAALIVGSGCVGLIGPAAAQDAILVSDNRKVTLTEAEGGTATASVTLTNPTTSASAVKVAPKASAATDCEITADPANLEPLQQQKVTLTFAAACDVERAEGTEFTLTVGDGDAFDLHADPPKQPSPNWAAVGIIYLLAAVLALVLLVAAFRHWTPPPSRWQDTKNGKMSLPGLKATWKFSDSWAANATVVTALFTGLFGTEEVTIALLGEEGSADLLSLALVSAAISVGLAGLSPMVLQMLRDWFDRKAEVPEPPGELSGAGAPMERPETMDSAGQKLIAGPTPADWYITPRGLVAAAVLTLAATAGQLATILYGLLETDFADDWILVVTGLLGLVLLGGYAWTNTLQNLTTGATLPAPEEKKAPGTGDNEEAVHALHVLKEELSQGATLEVDGQPMDPDRMLAILTEATAPVPEPASPMVLVDNRPSAIL